MRKHYCYECQKRIYESEGLASIAIESIKNAGKDRNSSKIFEPYLCYKGKGWHIGHLRKRTKKIVKQNKNELIVKWRKPN